MGESEGLLGFEGIFIMIEIKLFEILTTFLKDRPSFLKIDRGAF